jgi:hypothetical protein
MEWVWVDFADHHRVARWPHLVRTQSKRRHDFPPYATRGHRRSDTVTQPQRCSQNPVNPYLQAGVGAASLEGSAAFFTPFRSNRSAPAVAAVRASWPYGKYRPRTMSSTTRSPVPSRTASSDLEKQIRWCGRGGAERLPLSRSMAPNALLVGRRNVCSLG